MNSNIYTSRSPWKFFLLLFLLCLPFWLAGAFFDRLFPTAIPIDLPFAALIFLCPATAAIILTSRGAAAIGVRQLLSLALNYNRIRRKAWLLLALLYWPGMLLLEWAWMTLRSGSPPVLQPPTWLVPLSFGLFFFGAVGEELGWLGYAIDPLQERWGPLGASLILGIVRAAFHVAGFLQAGDAPAWIAWQCLGIVLSNIFIVWLYNRSGKSVFVAVVLHASYNVVSLVFPNYGFAYDPFLYFVYTAVAAGVILLSYLKHKQGREQVHQPVAKNERGEAEDAQVNEL